MEGRKSRLVLLLGEKWSRRPRREDLGRTTMREALGGTESELALGWKRKTDPKADPCVRIQPCLLCSYPYYSSVLSLCHGRLSFAAHLVSVCVSRARCYEAPAPGLKYKFASHRVFRY